MKRLISLIIFLATASFLAADDWAIELSGGGVLEARVLDAKPDRIFVDLGFTVLAIPRDAIVDMQQLSTTSETSPDVADATPDALEFTDLFSRNPELPALTVEEQVARIGEAVVLVQTPSGLGSGFIIHPDGFVITNDHVVAGEHEITVTVFTEDDNSSAREEFLNVRIVATSPAWDLALLKIEDEVEEPFVTVTLGESEEVRTGQEVFAVGNPLGLERSVSQGIVSRPNRHIEGRLYIQTTTEINPGNSGGPLLNLRGEVVGVNNMKVVMMGTEGLGFAIPVDVLVDFLRNRDAFAFDPRNPNAGFRYNTPPSLADGIILEPESTDSN